MEVTNQVPVDLPWFWYNTEGIDEILDDDFLDTDMDNSKWVMERYSECMTDGHLNW